MFLKGEPVALSGFRSAIETGQFPQPKRGRHGLIQGLRWAITSMRRMRSSAELWNRTKTVPSHDGIYRLRFAAGSHKEGAWDPGYFDFFRTPGQVHEKIAHQEARINDWGGILVGVYKPADPRKYFFSRVGLAVPVTAALDFTPSAPAGGRVRDATLALYDPTRRETVRVAGAQRPLAADFGALLAYYPEPGLLLGFMAMIRPANCAAPEHNVKKQRAVRSLVFTRPKSYRR